MALPISWSLLGEALREWNEIRLQPFPIVPLLRHPPWHSAVSLRPCRQGATLVAPLLLIIARAARAKRKAGALSNAIYALTVWLSGLHISESVRAV